MKIISTTINSINHLHGQTESLHTGRLQQIHCGHKHELKVQRSKLRSVHFCNFCQQQFGTSCCHNSTFHFTFLFAAMVELLCVLFFRLALISQLTHSHALEAGSAETYQTCWYLRSHHPDLLWGSKIIVLTRPRPSVGHLGGNPQVCPEQYCHSSRYRTQNSTWSTPPVLERFVYVTEEPSTRATKCGQDWRGHRTSHQISVIHSVTTPANVFTFGVVCRLLSCAR